MSEGVLRLHEDSYTVLFRRVSFLLLFMGKILVKARFNHMAAL